MNLINLNIKYLRLKNNLGQEDLALSLGYTRDNIASYERGTEPKLDFINKFVNYFHVTIDELVYSDLSEKKFYEKTFDKDETNNKSESTNNSKSIPLIPIQAIAGKGTGGDYSIILDEIEDRYLIPLFYKKGIDFLTTVNGISMFPMYNSGDVVACRFVKDRLFIQWGKVYVLDTISQGPLIKQIFQSATPKSSLTCHSVNPEFKDFEVPYKDIRTLSLVVGTIRLD